jgi:predicted nucleotidyltransferase
MPPKIYIDREQLAAFCRKWHIKRLWLFGSVLRDDFREDSDVDVMYEFEREARIGWKIVTAEDELAQILGHRVDFVAEKYLHPRIRNHPGFKKVLVYD